MININNVTYEVIPVGDNFILRMEQRYAHSTESYVDETGLYGETLIDLAAALADCTNLNTPKLSYNWDSYYLSGYIDVQHLSVNLDATNAKRVARYIHDTVRGII